MTKQTTISAKGLSKQFGDFTAVDSIDLEIYHGEVYGFLGPNGSGKTTSIRMLLGLIQPTAGEIEILGIPIKNNLALIRPKVGYMSQKFSLYNDLTVMQNLEFYGTAYGLSNTELKHRIAEAVDMAGLTGHENTQTKNLSGGWRQRLALSAAILHRPRVLFLDEPTAGVDPVSRRAFWDLLYILVAEGITVFVTTHYMDEAEHCHRLAFIQKGKIIAQGTPDEIKAKTMQGEVLQISPSDPIKAMKVLRSKINNPKLPIKEIELYGNLVHVVIENAKKHKKPITALLTKNGIKVDHNSIIEPSLEDAFISSMR